MTDADDEAVDALDSFGIDSPELRWLAVRDYLDEWQLAANDAVDEYQGDMRRQIRGLFLAADFLDLCESNARRRGEPPVRCVGDAPCECIETLEHPRQCSRAWGPRLIAADYLTARSVALAPYTGTARDRGSDVLDPYMLPMLRKGAK